MFKIKRSTDGQFYFTICSANNLPIVTSETYKRKENCKKGIAAIVKATGIRKANIIDETLEA